MVLRICQDGRFTNAVSQWIHLVSSHLIIIRLTSEKCRCGRWRGNFTITLEWLLVDVFLAYLQTTPIRQLGIVAGWWSVGEEAEDSVTLMSGGEPPLRKPYNSPTN